MKIVIDTDQIQLYAKTKLKEAKAYIKSLYAPAPIHYKIDVKQRGLATGQHVTVRRPERRQIKVKYVSSK